MPCCTKCNFSLHLNQWLIVLKVCYNSHKPRYKEKKPLLPPFMETPNVHLTPARTTAILALSEISRQFNYLLLKLDKYFLNITLQRSSECMNCLTRDSQMRHYAFVYPGCLSWLGKKVKKVRNISLGRFQCNVSCKINTSLYFGDNFLAWLHFLWS